MIQEWCHGFLFESKVWSKRESLCEISFKCTVQILVHTHICTWWVYAMLESFTSQAAGKHQILLPSPLTALRSHLKIRGGGGLEEVSWRRDSFEASPRKSKRTCVAKQVNFAAWDQANNQEIPRVCRQRKKPGASELPSNSQLCLYWQPCCVSCFCLVWKI